MTPSSEKLLFIAASAFASAMDRRAFLELACGSDHAMRDLIEELVALDRDSEEFFEFSPEIVHAGAEGDDAEGGGIGARIGPYRLIDRLGDGGYGVVYLAEQLAPVKRRVALKIVRLGMDTENVLARFDLEREALALMDHPNIARVLDAGATASGRPYFAMELVDGEKITDFCDRHCLDLRRRLELFIPVCEAIQHAHQKGVIHRDIKPSNVLVCDHAGRAVPKVIDFGIAKATAGSPDERGTTTTSDQLLGTPAYMSPEQADGGVDVDTRSDIYSLGALLCELLTGSPPLKLEDIRERGVEEIRNLVREGDSGAPSSRMRSVSISELGDIARRRGVAPRNLPTMLARDLDWIVLKAVEKDRQRRYETANALAMDVQRYLDEQPVLARPPSRRYLLAKLIRRNRTTFTAGSIALFGLLAGLGFSTWLFVRERDARYEQARLRVLAEHATANERRLREEANATDHVSRAAWLLRYNELEQADALLGALPAGKAPLTLEAAEAFKRVANWNLVQGRRAAAADRFHSLAHILAAADRSDWEGVSIDFLSVATAIDEWGKPGQYEEVRNLMIERFAGSPNPIVAEHVIKATLLKPTDPRALDKLQPLVTVLEESLQRADRSPHLMAWQQFSLALMAYRQERWSAAEEWARRSLATASNSEHRRASNQLILAMVSMKQGEPESARDTISDVRAEVARWTSGDFQIYNTDGTLWYNQWAVGLLLQEAERMLAGSGD